MSSAVDDLAETLAGLKHARDLALSKRRSRMLMPPRRIYPMSLVSAQMSINPFEFMMLIGMFIAGLSFSIAGVAVPGSVQTLLPTVWSYVWIINLTLGSLCGLVGGLYRKDPDRGLLIYQFGWGLVGMGTAVYGVAVLLTFPTKGLYPGLSNVLFSAAALMRVVQIQRFFKIADLMRKGLLQVPQVGYLSSIGGDGDDSERSS